MKKYLLILSLVVASLSLSFAQSIRINNELLITLQGVPESDARDTTKQYTVYSNGTINLPHIGSVSASGKTTDQLARHIENLYKSRQIYTNPTVNVTSEAVREEDTKTFTFRSQSGSKVMPYRRDLTLQEAIATAGGAGTFDSKKTAIVERNQKEYRYDMRNVKHRNVRIYPKDVIKLPHVNKDGFFKFLGGN